ncbi:MAG: glutathione-disulfide reductase [Myxococcota bacterium]
MSEYQYDLLVLGGGSGGLAASKRAASYGARVGLVEAGRVGGTCVIRGCIPKKLMVYASHAKEWLDLAADFGWNTAEHELSWDTLVDGRNATVHRLEGIHEKNLRAANVELIRGFARFIDPHHIEVEGRRISAANFLIATGATPVMPEIKGDGSSMTSDALFDLVKMPKSAVVIGGGYIAVEYAGILNGLGCDVTMLIRDQLLRGFDRELADKLSSALEKQGIAVRAPALVVDAHHTENGYHVHFQCHGQDHELDVDAAVVFAIGRFPNTQSLALDKADVRVGENGEVLVDEYHRTNVSHIYAVGDVLDKANLTPVAIKAGRAFADREFGGKAASMSYDTIPTAVFSQPPIGTVGLTEEQARAEYDDVQVFKGEYAPLFYSASPEERKLRSFVKMIVDGESDRVLGLHMLGADAPEIIQGFAVAVKAGLRKADFDATMAIHPTQAEEFVLMR